VHGEEEEEEKREEEAARGRKIWLVCMSSVSAAFLLVLRFCLLFFSDSISSSSVTRGSLTVSNVGHCK